jgi:hypothetical protein
MRARAHSVPITGSLHRDHDRQLIGDSPESTFAASQELLQDCAASVTPPVPGT